MKLKRYTKNGKDVLGVNCCGKSYFDTARNCFFCGSSLDLKLIKIRDIVNTVNGVTGKRARDGSLVLVKEVRGIADSVD